MAIEFPPLPPSAVTATLHEWRAARDRIQAESMSQPRWENIHRDPVAGSLVWCSTGKAITPETIEALQMMYRLADLRLPAERGDIIAFAPGVGPLSWDAQIPLPRDYPVIGAFSVMRRAAGYGIDPTDPFVNRIRDRLASEERQQIPNPAWRPGGDASAHVEQLTWFDAIPRMSNDSRDYLRRVVTRAGCTASGTYCVLGLRCSARRIQDVRDVVPLEERAQYNRIAQETVDSRSLLIPRIWEVA